MSLYSAVSHVFSLTAPFSKTVNTRKGNGKSPEGRRLVCYWHWHSKHRFLPTAGITARLLFKIGTHLPITEGLRGILRLQRSSLTFTKSSISEVVLALKTLTCKSMVARELRPNISTNLGLFMFLWEPESMKVLVLISWLWVLTVMIVVGIAGDGWLVFGIALINFGCTNSFDNKELYYVTRHNSYIWVYCGNLSQYELSLSNDAKL